MRRLDTLECERAGEELIQLVKEGWLTQEQAVPAIRALFNRGLSDEAGKLFDESCKRLVNRKTITEIKENENATF